jgi:biopolymer transport protein ExbD
VTKSFIDVLFILLLSTIVLLTESVHIGAVDTDVTRIGVGGVSPVRADRITLVAVAADELRLEDGSVTDIDRLADQVRPGDVVLLVTADGDVRHHRMMDVWSDLRSRQVDVKLGALPRADGAREG